MNKFRMSLLKSYFDFVLGKKVDEQDISFKEKSLVLIKTYFLTLILSVLSVIIILILKYLDLFPEIENQVKSCLIRKHGVFYILLLVGIIAPVFEEIVYRLFLRFSAINWAIFTGALLFVIDSNIRGLSYYSFDLEWLCRFAGLVIVILLTYPFYCFEKVATFLSNLLEKKFKYFLYASVIWFALMHSDNYGKLEGMELFIVPILVFPQVVYGFSCGFLRMNYGIIWSIALHIMINLIPKLFSLL